jgi:RHS repeat-associated protein
MANSSPTFLRFPGQWSDATWNGNKGYGLYYNVNRWYEDGRGRYTQPDPLGFDNGQDNLFGYALENPLKLTDPLGLEVTFAPACQTLLTARQRATVQQAAEDADAAGFQCLRPPECDRYRRSIRDLTIRCVAVNRDPCTNTRFCGSRSDFTTCSAAPLPSNTIILTPDGATGNGCPCLPRVLMHEVSSHTPRRRSSGWWTHLPRGSDVSGELRPGISGSAVDGLPLFAGLSGRR